MLRPCAIFIFTSNFFYELLFCPNVIQGNKWQTSFLPHLSVYFSFVLKDKIGTRLSLKPSSRLARSLRPTNIKSLNALLALALMGLGDSLRIAHFQCSKFVYFPLEDFYTYC